MLLCLPISLFWTVGTYALVQFYFIASPVITGMFFPEESDNQLHLSYFYSYFYNAKRNKVSEFAYQIGQFTGIQGIPGGAFRGCI